MEVQKTRKEDVWVDITKIVCVFCVAMGHCYSADLEILKWCFEFIDACVQVLFIFSGYYMVKNQSLRSDETAKRYIGHLVTMFLVWAGAHFIWDIRYTDRSYAGWFYQYVQHQAESFCALDSGHLWYLQNLILVVLLLYALKKERYTWKEAILFLVLASFVPKRMLRAAAGILFGGYLAQNKKTATKGKTAGLFVFGIGSLVLMASMYYLNVQFTHVTYILYLSWIQLLLNVGAMAICHWAINMDELYPMKVGAAGYYIRKIATGIYLVHMIFLQVGMVLASRHAIWGEAKYSFFCGGYTVAMSVAFSILLIWLSRFEKLKWLKKLY